jgi:hypothetical protein
VTLSFEKLVFDFLIAHVFWRPWFESQQAPAFAALFFLPFGFLAARSGEQSLFLELCSFFGIIIGGIGLKLETLTTEIQEAATAEGVGSAGG